MPPRIVHGEAIWRSKKLKSVPPEYRSYFSILLTLAEANGVFDADLNRVWSDVFSYNMDYITISEVEKMLTAFENAEMLVRWEQNDKVYGYWIGIDKHGRLPPKSRISRYKELPPDPPKELLEKYKGDDVGVNLVKRVKQVCRDYGMTPENETFYRKNLTELGESYGRQEVLDSFVDWIALWEEPMSNPVSSFVKSAHDFLSSPKPKQVNTTELEALCVSLYHIGNQVFASKYKSLLGDLLAQFSFQEIEKAYKEFIVDKDDFGMKHAARNFTEGGCQAIVSAARERQKKLEAQQEFMDQEAIRSRKEIQEVLSKLEDDAPEEL